jgi:hypothetical protein
MRSSPNTELTTVVVPADPGSVMELDPGGENVVVRLVPPSTCVLLFTVKLAAPAKFRSLVRYFCHSGHDWPADDERLVTKIYEWFWWMDNVTVPVQLSLESLMETAEARCVALAAHERHRISSFQAPKPKSSRRKSRYVVPIKFDTYQRYNLYEFLRGGSGDRARGREIL